MKMMWVLTIIVMISCASADEYWWRYILTNRHRFNQRGVYAEYLQQNPTHRAFIVKGVHIAVVECKRLFQYSRWGCKSHNHRKPFGDIVDLGCRETAFIYAITSAGVAYETIRACSQGKLAGCQNTCSKDQKDLDIKKTILVNATHTLNEACNDDLHAGYRTWNDFVFKGEQSSDIRANFNLRNSFVGIKELGKSTSLTCRCHGVSGSCVNQVCSEKMPGTFRIIGKKIYEKYVTAKYDRPNQRIIEEHAKFILATRDQGFINTIADKQQKFSSKTHDLKNLRRTKRSNMFNDVENLEYFERSPNFCLKNKYSTGIESRTCKNDKSITSTNQDAVKSCKELCCYGKTFQNVQVMKKTNCKFHYCCTVTCDKELGTVKQYRCL